MKKSNIKNSDNSNNSKKNNPVNQNNKVYDKQGYDLDLSQSFTTYEGTNGKTVTVPKGEFPTKEQLKSIGLYTDENKIGLVSNEPVGSTLRTAWNSMMDTAYENQQKQLLLEKTKRQLNKSTNKEIVSSYLDADVLNNIKMFLELGDRNISYLIRELLLKYAITIGLLPIQKPNFDDLEERLRTGQLKLI